MSERTRCFLITLLLAVSAFVALAAAPAHAFHFPWDQGHDTFDPDDGDDDTDPEDDPCNDTGCPFSVSTGNFFHKAPDLRIPTLGQDIRIFRTYNSRDMRSGPVGHGWSFSYDFRLVETTDGVSQYAILHKPNGARIRFLRNPDGSFSSPPDVDFQLVKNPDTSYTLTDSAKTQHRFDSVGRLTTITDPNSQALGFEYDSFGFLTRAIDPSGRSVGFTKGPNGKISSMVDPAGRVFRYDYDADGNLTAFTNPLGEVTTYEYDAKSNLILVRDAANNIIQRASYDSEGRVATFTEQGDDEIWSVSYFPSQNRTTKRDSLGNTWVFEYNNNGNIVRTTDPLGGSEEFTYDANFGISSFKDKNGNSESYTYDADRRLLATGAGETFTYDPATNQMLSATDALGNTTSYEYDAVGNLTKIVGALSGETLRTYDSNGFLTNVRDALGNVTSFSCDLSGNVNEVVSPLGNRRTFTYGPSGNILSRTDAAGRTTEFTYADSFILGFNDNDGVASVKDPLGNIARFSYDQSGNLTEIVDANGNIERLEHDSVGRVTKSENALTQARTYTYDSKGRIASATDAKGQTISYSYNALGWLIQKVMPGNTVTFNYDKEGNITNITDNDSSVSFVYDSASRIVETQTAATSSQPATTLQFAYDNNGNKIRMTDPSGGVTTYSYDQLDRLVAMTDPIGETITFSYDALSRRSGISMPNGVTTTYSFDAEDRLLSVATQSGATVLSSFDYGYDSVGNRTSMVDTSGAHQYSYDALDRLVGASHPTPSNPPESYTYDPEGNRLASHSSTSYVYDAANRLFEDDDFTYTYDANGNLTQKTHKTNSEVTQFDYDAEDQLVRIVFPDGTNATYLYDGLGRRIEKNVGGQTTRYIYDGDDILLELDGSNGILARYTHGPGSSETSSLQGPAIDEPLIVDRGGSRSYYHTDGLGSVVQLTDGAANVVRSYEYDSFGNITAETGSVSNSYTFTGRELDAESGLYYYRARYYDPVIGRFLSEDLVSHGMMRSRAGMYPAPFPIIVETGELNLYLYAHNNPVNFNDPKGLGDSEWGKLPGTDIDYRIDWREQPAPDMHVYWKDGTETNITHEGGWRRGKHRGQDLVRPPKKHRKPLRKVVKKFVKKAGKLIPVVGIAFWLLDAQEAYALTQDPCSGAGDYVNIIVPYKDIGSLFK